MNNFQISKEIEFDAGHRVPSHTSKCKNPHGHRYRVRVWLEGELVRQAGAPTEGMVEDFGELKQWMMTDIHDVYDHGFVIFEGDQRLRQALVGQAWKVIVVPWIPTAESFAYAIWENMKNRFGPMVQYVEVWETPTSMARYPALVTL